MDTNRRCSLPQCSGLRFNLVHKFPRKMERTEEWLKAFDCPRLYATPRYLLQQRHVCCRHFREEDYVHRKARTLNPTAVPSLNLKEMNELHRCRQTRVAKPTTLTPEEVEWLQEIEEQHVVLKLPPGYVTVSQLETNQDEAGDKMSESEAVSNDTMDVMPPSLESIKQEENTSVKEEKKNTTDFELLINEDVLKIVDSRLKVSLNVNVLWLRSMCRCSKCYDDIKCVTKYNFYEIPDDLQPAKAMLNEESRTLEIIWSDDHISTYNLYELYEKFQSKPATTGFNKYLLWTSSKITYSDDLQPLQYHDITANFKNVTYKALDRLQKTGVLIIQGLPKSTDKNSVFKKYLLTKLFNHNWDNIISEKRILLTNHQNNTPFTNCTFESMDKALQILTIPYDQENMKIPLVLVDGYQAASEISKTSYEFLTQYSMDFGFTSKNGFKYIIEHPVIAMGERILFAPHNIENIKSQDFQQISKSLKNFNDVLNLKENQWNVELNNDTVVIIDNYRICWNIKEMLTENELVCFYIERKHYLSSLNTLKTRL